MGQHVAEGLAATLAAAQGVWKGDAYQQRESGLDGVVEAHADPLDVGLIKREYLPDGVCREGFGDLGEAEDFSSHEEHDQAAIGVDGEVAGDRRGRGVGRGGHLMH